MNSVYYLSHKMNTCVLSDKERQRIALERQRIAKKRQHDDLLEKLLKDHPHNSDANVQIVHVDDKGKEITSEF